jgi:rRNA maturation RNase YbeY
MGRIYFSCEECGYVLKKKRRLSEWLRERALKEGFDIERVRIVLCNDILLHQINNDFLKHNTLTDIISFQYNEKGKPLEGELYISVERVRENADKFGEPFEKELSRVMVHGLLHFCGYPDKTKEEKDRMRNKEDEALDSFWTDTASTRA